MTDPSKESIDFERNGALILNDVIDHPLISKAYEYIDVLLRDHAIDTLWRVSNVGEMRWMIALDFVPPFNDEQFWCNPKVHSVLGSLLGEDYQISNFGAVCALPGASLQRAHCDGGNLLFPKNEVNYKLPCWAITVCFPLIQMSAAHGITQLTLGSHHDPLADNLLTTIPDKGSCIMWDFRLCHRGLENISDTMRPLLYFTACRPWFIDHTNNESRMPMFAHVDWLSDLSTKAQHLLGRVQYL